MSKYPIFLMLMYANMAYSCAVDEAYESDNALDEFNAAQQTGATSDNIGALIDSYDVGVLAGYDECLPPVPYASFELLWILIDNEDRRNANSRSGWLGSSYSSTNTQFQFCRIDGTTLRNAQQPYMVLSLSSQCPTGSTRIKRHFDSEDSNPISQTNITSVSIIEDAFSRDVSMYFCWFEGGGGSGFPDLHITYGVFAAGGFAPAIQSGHFGTDDEDSNNSNYWKDASGQTGNGVYKTYNSILEGGTNTILRVARVR